METTLIEARSGEIKEYGTNRISIKKCDYQPGDLSKFAPYGSGFYGYQPLILDPFKTAPPQENTGGIIFFPADSRDSFKTKFQSTLELLGVKITANDFSVFQLESENPQKDGYLKQMRIVSKFASRCHFNAITDSEYESFHNQEINTFDFLMHFIDSEIKKWGTSCFDNNGLWGKFGGDGNYAKEALCFGFTIENSYFGIYRIWSRAWLVTK